MRRSIFKVFKKLSKPMWGTKITRFPLVYDVFKLVYGLVRPRDTVLTEVEGRKMYANPGDIGASRSTTSLSLILSGTYKKLLTDFFKKEIKPGMTVVDLGAHIGYFTLLAAELVGKNGKVFAFEAAPDNYTLLIKNIAINGYQNVFPVQKAVSNRTGSMTLVLFDYDSCIHYVCDSYDGKDKSVTVETITLDEFLKDAAVDFIKMNIEGSEMAALQGMPNLLERNKNIKIVTEFAPGYIRRNGSTPKEFLDMLIGNGFNLYLLNEKRHCIEALDVDSFLETCDDTVQSVDLLCVKGA